MDREITEYMLERETEIARKEAFYEAGKEWEKDCGKYEEKIARLEDRIQELETEIDVLKSEAKERP